MSNRQVMLTVLLALVLSSLLACGSGVSTATPEPTATPASTPMPTQAVTPTSEPTSTTTPDPTSTATSTPTHTATPEPTVAATSTPTGTAIPTPTPTSVSGPSPITIDLGTRWQEVFDDLAPSEQACILADVEDIESALSERVMTDDDAPRWWQVSFFACLDPETANSLFFSIFVMEILTEEDFDATDEQAQCLRGQMDGLEVMRTIEGMASEDPAVLGEMMSRFVPCVSDFVLSGLLEGIGIDLADLTDAELNCLDEWVTVVDWSVLMATEGMGMLGDVFNCVPDAAVAMLLEGEVAGPLTDEENDCVRQLLVDVDWASLDNEADFLPVIWGILACIPSLSQDIFDDDGGDAGRPDTPTPEPTGAPEPTATPVRGSVETDREALMILSDSRNDYSFHNWSHRDNWWTEAPLGEWYGVTTDDDGRVVGLELAGNRLTGGLPPQLGNLSRLEVLDLSDNRLSGEIPSELGNLSNLKVLNLRGMWLRSGVSVGELSGEIPFELGSLSNLETLNLAGNRLSGGIPSELGDLSNLVALRLFANELGGQIPVQLGDLSNLKVLALGGSELSGGIPPELGKLSSLEVLGLEANELSGGIPPELSNLSNLKALWLYGNDLRGEIPPALGNLSNLVSLQLNGNLLEGCIPGSLQGQLDLNRSSFARLTFC